ncbi:MAG: membrane protein insertion efficiency factor YidD [Pseudonocardiaceae bacterium]
MSQHPISVPRVHTGAMAPFRRRRYDRRYDDPYYQPRRGGGSCIRDACLLDAGCCLGESLSGNCLVMTLLAGPQLAATLLAEARTLRRKQATAGSRVTGLLLAGVHTYQREISPRRAPCCHFTPSCSEYAAQALQIHGARRGGWLTLKRLGRCRPRTPTTHDSVPPPHRG